MARRASWSNFLFPNCKRFCNTQSFDCPWNHCVRINQILKKYEPKYSYVSWCSERSNWNHEITPNTYWQSIPVSSLPYPLALTELYETISLDLTLHGFDDSTWPPTGMLTLHDAQKLGFLKLLLIKNIICCSSWHRAGAEQFHSCNTSSEVALFLDFSINFWRKKEDMVLLCWSLT